MNRYEKFEVHRLEISRTTVPPRLVNPVFSGPCAFYTTNLGLLGICEAKTFGKYYCMSATCFYCKFKIDEYAVFTKFETIS